MRAVESIFSATLLRGATCKEPKILCVWNELSLGSSYLSNKILIFNEFDEQIKSLLTPSGLPSGGYFSEAGELSRPATVAFEQKQPKRKIVFLQVNFLQLS